MNFKGVGEFEAYSRGINDLDHLKKSNVTGGQLTGVYLQRQIPGR